MASIREIDKRVEGYMYTHTKVKIGSFVVAGAVAWFIAPWFESLIGAGVKWYQLQFWCWGALAVGLICYSLKDFRHGKKQA